MEPQVMFSFGNNFDDNTSPNTACRDDVMPSDHRFLFAFLDADLTPVGNLISSCIKENRPEHSMEAFRLISSLHPYFELDKTRAAQYVNRSILAALKDSPGREDAVLLLGVFLPGMPRSLPCPSLDGRGTIRSAALLQKRLRRSISFLLDDTDSDMARLSLPVRAALGSNCMGSGTMVPLPEGVLYFQDPEGIRKKMTEDECFAAAVSDASDELEKSGKMTGFMKKLACGIGQGPPPVLLYKTPYLEDLLLLEFYMMLTEGVRLKRCENCGRFFPVTKYNSRYCDLAGEGGKKSCLALYGEEKLKDELVPLYKKAYNRKYMQYKRGNISGDEMEAFKRMAKDLRQEVFHFRMTPGEYYEKLTQ